jgi:hypothetical protein
VYVCEPSATETRALAQLPTPVTVVVPLEAAPSNTSTVALGSAVPASVNEPVLFVAPWEGVSITGAGGGVLSIVHVRLAGVASVFPAASVALTWKVWLPSPSAE